jgi:hypothetical protein
VVVYGCETGFLTLGKELKLRVFENRVLRWHLEDASSVELDSWILKGSDDSV